MPDRLANYVPVAERLTQAQGELIAVDADPPLMLTDVMGFIRVAVYLSDGRKATGTASFRLDLDGRSAQATNPIEDCETSAVGRALAMLGYSSSRSIASREEVREAQRRADAPQQARPQPRPAPQQPPQANGHADPANGAAKVPASPAKLRKAIQERWMEERRLGGSTPSRELALDLEALNTDALIELGTEIKGRIAELEALPAL